jgi:hypothetical protein
MSQKEDILEQIVEEFLIHEGFFVQRNIKYRPNSADPEYNSSSDSVSSDIDILAVHPRRVGPSATYAVNIKSWQGGFRFASTIAEIEHDKKISGKSSRLRYRELAIEKWSKAFVRAIAQRTGRAEFTHVLAVTLAKGDESIWVNHKPFRDAMEGNPLKVLTLKQMVEAIEARLTRTPAATDIGRTLQLFRAAGLRTASAPPVQISETVQEPD